MIRSYGKDEKKVIFACLDKTHAELLIRLRHDGFRQGEFFRNFVSLYLKNDSRVLSITEELREEKQKYGKKKRKEIQDSYVRRSDKEKLYGLTEAEKEEIFDLLELEIGDL